MSSHFPFEIMNKKAMAKRKVNSQIINLSLNN